jgi:hypothetical protein
VQYHLHKVFAELAISSRSLPDRVRPGPDRRPAGWQCSRGGGLEFGDEFGGDAAALADLDALGFGPGPNRLGVISSAVQG